MKAKNYEQMGNIVIGIIILIILEILEIVVISKQKEFDYLLLSGVVIKKNYTILTVTKEEKKVIYDNSVLFFYDSKKKYRIIEDYGKVLSNQKKDYYQIMIKFSFPNRYKANDNLKIVFPNKKYPKINIFKTIWGGD